MTLNLVTQMATPSVPVECLILEGSAVSPGELRVCKVQGSEERAATSLFGVPFHEVACLCN